MSLICQSTAHKTRAYFTFTVLSRPYALKPTAGQSKIFVLLLKIICVNYVKPGKHNCEDHFHLYSLSTVHSYDLYHIHFKVNQAGSHLKAIQIRRTCNEFVEWSLLFSLYFFQFFISSIYLQSTFSAFTVLVKIVLRICLKCYRSCRGWFVLWSSFHFVFIELTRPLCFAGQV